MCRFTIRFIFMILTKKKLVILRFLNSINLALLFTFIISSIRSVALKLVFTYE
jgi:hypothetical protein